MPPPYVFLDVSTVMVSARCEYLNFTPEVYYL